MINQWEEGQIYVWIDSSRDHRVFLHSDVGITKFIKVQSGVTFITLLEKPRSTKNGNISKVLTGDGEVFWMKLNRLEWNPLSKRWLRKQNEQR